METLKKRDILQEVLAEYGYSGWYVIEPDWLNPENRVLFNPKEKKLGEIAIPDEWLDDPSRRSVIRETLASVIQDASYVVPYAHLRSSRLSRP